jgi:hypothetical protein
VQLKAETYTREMLHGNQPSGSAIHASEDPSAATPMDITIDPESTHSETEEGNAGGDAAETREV